MTFAMTWRTVVFMVLVAVSMTGLSTLAMTTATGTTTAAVAVAIGIPAIVAATVSTVATTIGFHQRLSRTGDPLALGPHAFA
jgi:hypothetical protein